MSTYRSVNDDGGGVEARILDSARRHFTAQGYAGASMREIAATAAVTKPTLYYHFGSKEGLFRRLVDRTFHRYRERLTAAREPGTTFERLLVFARGAQSFAAEDPELLRFIAGCQLGGIDEAGRTTERFRALELDILEDVLGEAQSRGELVSFDLETLIFLARGAIVMPFFEAVFHAHPMPPASDLVERAVQAFWSGIGLKSQRITP